MKEKAIINCHTHIFSAADIPPFIARCFVPWPFYILTYFPLVFAIFSGIRKLKRPLYLVKKTHRKIFGLLRSNYLSSVVLIGVLLFLLLNSIYFLLEWFGVLPEAGWGKRLIDMVITYRVVHPELIPVLKFGIVGLALVSTKMIRGILWKLTKLIFKPLSFFPDAKTLEFLGRYLKIAAIANYKHQRTAFNKLYKMYPPGSKFVVLPMDMEYMNWTRPRSYLDQLEELNKMLNSKTNANYKNILAFLFVDPRRIREDRKKKPEKPFFDYELKNGRIGLKDSYVKRYLETLDDDPDSGKFRGIKIYPAIGYHAFDEDLLPLWLYCVQREIPIVTHCTVGTIFYRRKMEKEWFTHPVFERSAGEKHEMYAKKNAELQRNFTHPLNYLVLLEPMYLKKLLKNCRKETQELFGYAPDTDTLERDLSELKINIAHYGGIDQWERHMQSDRSEEAQEIIEMPTIGVRMFAKQSDENEIMPYKPASLWNKVDWYTIISSLMLQYKNIYADISYILHTPHISSLLNLTLSNEYLNKKVLFGTDYYVVRNHKSEKELYAEMLSGLTDAQLDQIAIDNPNQFLALAGEQKKIL